MAKTLLHLTALLLCALAPATARADQSNWQTTLSFGVARQPLLDEANGEQAIDLHWTPLLEAEVRQTHKFSPGSHLRFSAALALDGQPMTNLGLVLDSRLNAEFQNRFGADNRWTFRIRGSLDHSFTEEETTFQRVRTEGRLTYRLSAKHSTSVIARVGTRDQNDAIFEGFDQTELWLGATHVWRPRQDRLAITTTIYHETRRAEFDQYSYDETGVRLAVRVPASDKLEFTLRGLYYERGFQDGFSWNDPTIREDRRIKFSLEAERELTEKWTGFAMVGWDLNDSNIDQREFSGAVVEFSAAYEW